MFTRGYHPNSWGFTNWILFGICPGQFFFLPRPEVPARWHVFEADGFGAMTTFWRNTVNKLGWWSWVCPNLGDSPRIFYGHFKKEHVKKGVLHQETSGEARLIWFSWWFCDSKRAKYFDLYLIHPLTSFICVPGSQSGRVTFVDIKEYVVFLVPVLPEPQTNGGCWRIYEKHQVWWLHKGGPPKSDVHNGKMGNTTVDGRNPALVGRWFISL